MTIQHHPHPIEKLPPSRSRRLLKALTSYYGIALLVAIACTYGFSWLADEVLEGEFGNLNSSVLLAIHAHRSVTLDNLAFTVTWLGSSWGVMTIGVLLTGALLLMRRYVDLATFAAVLVGATLMVATFKLVFHQLRPQVFTPLVVESNYSFPSGHSLTSFALWGFFAWWIVSIRPKDVWRWALALLGIVIAALVALSRLYLGVHWPTDVTAGVFLGFGWVAVCAVGQRWLTRHARRERRQMIEGQLQERRQSRMSPVMASNPSARQP
jgi:undecaprenyl-diphosphatase